ncbi:MAG TPA: primosomal protein N', partial [Desulfobacteria bacterium]|nr:primosomal protein N' [Desulfobacteria bacterium]
TPSIESYARATAGKYRLLTMGGRVMGRPMPVVKVIDLREEIQAGNRGIFSRSLVDSISGVLAKGEQSILFLNRRGYSTFVVCRECGLVMNCPKCSITLTHHAAENTLRCHYCDYRRKAPDICPKCGSKSIRHFGIGTQRVEEEVLKLFPDATVARMDMDTTTAKGSHERILDDFKKGRTDILIGTQMIAKGLDFPGVTLVGVVTADTALNLPDFRAAEKTFQLLTQVAGRAGRGDAPGEVLVQTYSPGHYSVVNAQKHDYLSFYNEEIKMREALVYPPYSSLVRILIFGNEENSVIRGSQVLAYELEQILKFSEVGVDQPLLGPAPAPLSRLRDRFRWQICIKGKQGKNMRGIVKKAVAKVVDTPVFANLGISVDVDPVSMM